MASVVGNTLAISPAIYSPEKTPTLTVRNYGASFSFSQRCFRLPSLSFRRPSTLNTDAVFRRGSFSSFRCFAALTPELKTTIDKVVTSNKVILFMKGTRDFPQCGFSNTVVQILKSLNVPFETINILENEFLRQGLKEYSSWPTFPQLYIDGEFFGGCDIVVEALKSGELQETLEKAMCS
ncbi:monothiol glutaredoxin-S7, chloroplastic-like [Chenopodium quinoa]|uniref:Glutaredoxin domain-containing protein n=1 Tax=Chenopodium quinoa TaxID=63459 RepID=A0A803MCN0_CHEQI|nr:monothiol glutaredoxin-S7, chloroplastic-like [Chenopodium quinoa]